jgi:hypothetical protein
MPALRMRLFVPSPRQTNFLLLAGFAALGAAVYIRYGLVESAAMTSVCEGDVVRAGCTLRRMALELQQTQIFGGIALIAAAVHFWRPSVAAFAVALVATAFGLLLFNASAAAFAAGLLILAFARPVLASTSTRASTAPPQTTPPASSETTR